jgi:Ca2+-dependent lipid-binding protein
MTRLLQEIKDDLNFIKSHSLQPQWYKALKIFILVGFLAGYYYLFGFIKTVIFFVVFIFLMLLVHLIYRIKTNKFRKSWLDVIVVESDEGVKAKSIGKLYYAAIILNALCSVIISQSF